MSENKPLTQTLKLQDNFTSVLGKIEKKLKATTGVLNDFAKLGSTPVSLSMEVKDEEFKASINGVKREFDSLTALANKGVRMDMYNEQLEEQANKIKSVKDTYNNSLEDMMSQSRKYQSSVDLTSEKLALLNEKAEIIQTKMFGTTDDGKLNQLALQMNTVDGQIQKTVGTLEQQKQKLQESQEAMNFLASRTRDLENAYESAARAAQAMADVPSRAEEKENRRIAQIQTLKDKYEEAARAQQQLSNEFRLPKGLGQTISMTDRLGQSAQMATAKMRTGIAGAQVKLAQMTNSVRVHGSAWVNSSINVEGMSRKIDSIKTKYLGLSKGQVGWNGLITAGKSKLSGLVSSLSKSKQAVESNVTSQKKMTREAGNTSNALKGVSMAAKLINFNFAIAGARKLLDTVSSIMGKVDEMTSIQTKINMISDTPEQAKQTNKNIMGAANDSRSSYGDTADFVTKVAVNSGDAFNNTDEIVKFTNTLQKMYKIGGATAAEQNSSMMQLQQSLAQGYMQGQELNSVMKGAPQLIDAIAKELDVPRGKLKDMGKDGEISADVIRRAMFSASADIDKKFSEMPMRWEDAMNLVKNTAFDAFSGIQEKISEFINSASGQALIQAIIQGLYILADIANFVIDLAMQGIQWVMDNMPMVIDMAYLLGTALLIAATVAFAGWVMANLPLIAMIGIVYIIIGVLGEFGISARDIFLGVLTVIIFVGTILYNGVLYLVGAYKMGIIMIINAFKYFLNHIIIYAEFFYNVWKHPIFSIKKLFYNMIESTVDLFSKFVDSTYKVGEAIAKAFLWGANKAIDGINWIIEALNKIPGINIGTIGNIDTNVDFSDAGQKMRDGIRKFKPKNQPDDYKEFNRFEYDKSDALNDNISKMKDPTKAADTANKFLGGIEGMFSGAGDKMEDWKKSQKDWTEGVGGKDFSGVASPDNGYSPDAKAAKKIGKGKDLGKVDADAKIKDEDLKYLRDIAEKQFTVNYQQLTPQATVNYYGAGGTDEDVDRLLGRMEAMISEKSDANLY